MDKLIIFFGLRVILIVFFFFVGYVIIKSKKRGYWKYLVPCIVLFTLNEGLRFGRGRDYNGYYFTYKDIINNSLLDRKMEYLFKYLCEINNYLGFSYQGLIMLMSFVLISSGAIFLKNHRMVLMFSLPLFYVYTLDAENLMRWFLGFSFILIGISYLEKKNHLAFFIFAIIGSNFHNGLYFLILVFYGVFFLKKTFKTPIFAVGAYIAIFILFSTSYMQDVAVLFSKLPVFEQFEGYTMNAEAWLTGTVNEGNMTGVNIGVALTDILTIIIGFKIVKYIPSLTYYYNLYLIGVILSPAFYQIEILFRFCLLFKLFQFIILGYAFYFFIWKKIKLDSYSHLYTWLILLNIIRVYVINIFLISDVNTILYIWDSAGRKILNLK